MQAHSHLGIKSEYMLAEAAYSGNLDLFFKAVRLLFGYTEVIICAGGGGIMSDVGRGSHEGSRRLLY